MKEILEFSNGKKNWLQKGLLQVILILSLAAYGAVMTLTKSSGEDVALEKRLTALETCMNSMMSLPTDVAGIKANMAGLKETVDKIERTVNSLK